jgi:hypothetical protein
MPELLSIIFFLFGFISIVLTAFLLYWGFTGKSKAVNKILSLPIMILASLGTLVISIILFYAGIIIQIVNSLPH